MLAALIATHQPLQILSTSPLPNGTLGAFYSFLLLGSGGTLPYTWSVIAGNLPPGLTLNSATGVISGIVATPPGVFTFTIQLTDVTGSHVSRVFTITTTAAVYGNQFVAATTTFACIFLVKQALALASTPINPTTSSILNSAVGTLSQLYDQLFNFQSTDSNGYVMFGSLDNPLYLSNLIVSVIVIAIPLNAAIQSLPVSGSNAVALREVQRRMSLALQILQSLSIPITLNFG